MRAFNSESTAGNGAGGGTPPPREAGTVTTPVVHALVVLVSTFVATTVADFALEVGAVGAPRGEVCAAAVPAAAGVVSGACRAGGSGGASSATATAGVVAATVGVAGAARGRAGGRGVATAVGNDIGGVGGGADGKDAPPVEACMEAAAGRAVEDGSGGAMRLRSREMMRVGRSDGAATVDVCGVGMHET